MLIHFFGIHLDITTVINLYRYKIKPKTDIFCTKNLLPFSHSFLLEGEEKQMLSRINKSIVYTKL